MAEGSNDKFCDACQKLLRGQSDHKSEHQFIHHQTKASVEAALALPCAICTLIWAQVREFAGDDVCIPNKTSFLFPGEQRPKDSSEQHRVIDFNWNPDGAFYRTPSLYFFPGKSIASFHRSQLTDLWTVATIYTRRILTAMRRVPLRQNRLFASCKVILETALLVMRIAGQE